MKRRWISLLLVALLFALLAMTAALAEANDEIELVISDEELDLFSEPAYLDIPEEIELSFGESELPEIKEIGDIMLDTSLDSMEPTTDPASSAAVSNADSDDFEIVNGILVKYKGAGGDVVIPDGVTVIGKEAFKDCSGLTSITIPNSVTSIGESAFRNCSSLTDITIPNSVTSIGAGAFEYCSGLTDITIPNSVTSIGGWAFYGCSGLTGITIPDSVTSIYDGTFHDCSGLTSITIPNSVTSIDFAAFSGCSGLTSITIPNSVTSIGESAFRNCSSLTDITIPNSVTSIDYAAFYGCSGLTGITIPDSVTGIGPYAFSGCSGLTSVTIGKGIHHINFFTFENCYRLESIVFPPNITLVENKAFGYCYNLTDITIENGDITIEDGTFTDCPATMTFHTPCESKATKWAESKGYTVIKSDHTPVTDPAVDPTCTETGLTEGSHCSVCNAILTAQEVVPAKGHKPVTDPAVAPTLTQTGLTEGSHCSVCGKVLVAQEIVPKLISIKKCSITGISDKVYAAKAFKPAPVVKYKGKTLKKGTDYTVSYKDNKKIGTATVTITGKGKYGESVKKTFKINPKPVTLSAVTPGSRQLTVKWKKGKGITGYEVQYGLKRSFASARKVVITNAATVKTVLKELKAKKKYYIRIRTYKKVKGKKYYSAWSKAKTATTKK